jgi:hypothetical protein
VVEFRKRSKRLVPLALLIACAAIAPAPVPARAADAPRVRTVRIPDGGVYAQAAVDAAGVIHLVYCKGDPGHADVYYVRSGDGGATFSRPLRVNSQDNAVILTGTVRGPQMALGKGGRVHVSWMGSDTALPKAKGRQTPMLHSRLNDAGDAFEPQRNLIQNYPGLDGGGSVAADDEGNVYVAWHAPRAEQNEADRHVWIARSRDEGKTFGPETMADPQPVGACGCCGMKISAGPGRGEVYILYRSAMKMVNRDMQLLASTDYGRTFRVAAAHPFKIGQCVMSTAAFSRSSDSILAAWETQKQVYLAAVRGDGAPVIGPSAVPGEGDNRKHPSLATNRAGQTLLAWTEGTGWNKGGGVAWQAYDRDGRPIPNQAGRAEGLPVWGVAAAVALPDGSFRVIY